MTNKPNRISLKFIFISFFMIYPFDSSYINSLEYILMNISNHRASMTIKFVLSKGWIKRWIILGSFSTRATWMQNTSHESLKILNRYYTLREHFAVASIEIWALDRSMHIPIMIPKNFWNLFKITIEFKIFENFKRIK